MKSVLTLLLWHGIIINTDWEHPYELQTVICCGSFGTCWNDFMVIAQFSNLKSVAPCNGDSYSENNTSSETGMARAFKCRVNKIQRFMLSWFQGNIF